MLNKKNPLNQKKKKANYSTRTWFAIAEGDSALDGWREIVLTHGIFFGLFLENKKIYKVA